MVFNLHFQAYQGWNGVDAAGGEQDKASVPPLAGFEQIDGPTKVMLNQLAGTGLPIDAGQHAGIRSGIDDPIERAQGFKIRGIANIAMNQVDPLGDELVAIEPRTISRKVINPDDL